MTSKSLAGRSGRVVAAFLAFSGAGFVSSPTALAQSAGQAVSLSQSDADLSATQSLKRATALMDAGRLIDARALMNRLVQSGGQAKASDDQRREAAALLRTIDRRIAEADPNEMSLQKAELALALGDSRVAERHAKAVFSKDEIPLSTKQRAGDLIAEIAARRAELSALVPDAVTQAVADFEAGRFAEAKALLAAVVRSGVELTEEQESQVDAYSLKVVQHENETGPIPAPSDPSYSLLQPGKVRRDKPAEPAPAAPAPAAEPVTVTAVPTTVVVADEPAPTQPETAPATQPVEVTAASAEPPPPPASAPPAEDDIVAIAMRAQGQQLLAEGDQLFGESRFPQAIDKYTAVLASYRPFLPADDVAHAESQLNNARARLNQNAGTGIADAFLEQFTLIQQQTDAAFQNYMSQAKAALEQGEPTRARDLAASAELTINNRRTYFDAPQVEAYRAQIADIRAQADVAIDTMARAAIEKQAREQAAAAAAAQRTQATDKDRKITEAIERARALQAEQKYEEALQVVDQILFLEPNNPTGLLLHDVYTDILAFRAYNKTQRLKTERHAAQTLDNEATMIPPLGIMDFPEDWPLKTFERGEVSAYAESPENRKVLAQLENDRIPASFTDNTVADVLNYINSMTKIDIDVDWDALEEIGVAADDLVTLNLHPLPARVLLERVLDKVSQDDFSRASWGVRDGILTVSSDAALRKDTRLVIYNIMDLLIDIPDFPDAPEIDLQSVLQGSEGGNSQSPFRDQQDEQEEDDRPTRQERIDLITQIIQQNVDSDGWVDSGGETGRIQELNGSLIITNTPRNHREIVGLLSKLREIRSMQINVETKFLLVNQDWFEQVGFDVDVVLNASNNQFVAARNLYQDVRPSDFFDFSNNANGRGLQRNFGLGRDIDLNGNGTITGAENDSARPVGAPNPMSPIGGLSNSLGLASGLAADNEFASSIINQAPALGIAGQFLDDVQVDFLILATQADSRSVQLTAPRLTLTNGQTSNIFVVTQQAFVSDLEPVTGDSAVGFDPEVDVANEGVTMLVEAVVSADRRYVTMNIDAGVSRIDGFAEQPVTAVAGGQLVNSADTQSFIQLPTVTVTRVRTTATVPDEGTLLLGGQRLVTELDIETGVPVLSKLPIINRFFTNRIESKQEQTLLILVKPTILIAAEQEEKAFPGLLDSLKTGVGLR